MVSFTPLNVESQTQIQSLEHTHTRNGIKLVCLVCVTFMCPARLRASIHWLSFVNWVKLCEYSSIYYNNVFICSAQSIQRSRRIFHFHSSSICHATHDTETRDTHTHIHTHCMYLVEIVLDHHKQILKSRLLRRKKRYTQKHPVCVLCMARLPVAPTIEWFMWFHTQWKALT